MAVASRCKKKGPQNLDYHVEAAGFLYSGPHALIRQQVDVRLNKRTVEIPPGPAGRSSRAPPWRTAAWH
jgi:hypothetical protein